MDTYIIAGLIVFLGGVVQASSGFGFAIITMALFPLINSVTDSMIITTASCIAGLAWVSVKYFKYINFKILVLPTIFALIGISVGLTSLFSVDNTVAIKLLGAALIVLSIYFFFFAKKVCIKSSWMTASAAGIVSGLMSGFFNIGGPPIVLYYSAATSKKEEYIGTLQFYFLLCSLFKLGYFIIDGRVTAAIAQYLPFTIIATVVGTLLGNYAFRKLSTASIKKMVYIVMALAGVWYVLR